MAENRPGSPENFENRDLSHITEKYDEAIRYVDILLEAKAGFQCWFCDEIDDVASLVDKLKSDLSKYDPKELCLTGELSSKEGHALDPWSSEIAPFANSLSHEQIEQAVIILTLDPVSLEYEKTVLMELIRGIDSYVEHAGDNKRYPVILVTSKKFMYQFYNSNELEMPNWEGFRGRQKMINVLSRDE